MSNALQLVSRVRSDLKRLNERILHHPYLNALEGRRVSRDALRVFAGQQYHIITSDLRSIALLVSRHGNLPSRKFFLNVLQGEAAALDALHSFARALAMSGDDLEAFEPLLAAHAYCAFVAMPPNRGHGDLSSRREGWWRIIFAKGKVEIGNSG